MSVPVVCALFLTAIAAYFDWRWQKIPNLLALTGWVIGAGLWMGFRGFRGLSVWALGALIPGLAALAVCRLGAIGAGDVKLISALGAILSYKRGLWVFLAAGVLAVVAGIGRYMQKGELHLLPGRVLHRLQEICHGEVSAKAGETRVCFAAMLFGGVLLRAQQEWWWLH